MSLNDKVLMLRLTQCFCLAEEVRPEGATNSVAPATISCMICRLRVRRV